MEPGGITKRPSGRSVRLRPLPQTSESSIVTYTVYPNPSGKEALIYFTYRPQKRSVERNRTPPRSAFGQCKSPTLPLGHGPGPDGEKLHQRRITILSPPSAVVGNRTRGLPRERWSRCLTGLSLVRRAVLGQNPTSGGLGRGPALSV